MDNTKHYDNNNSQYMAMGVKTKMGCLHIVWLNQLEHHG